MIPYNPYLEYNAPIIVQVCSAILYNKYLFKYCYKGHDGALVESKLADNVTLSNDNNDKGFALQNSSSSPETIDGLLEYPEYPMNQFLHVIHGLVIHNENKRNVYSKKGYDEEFHNETVELI